VWDVTVFTKNRERLLEGDIAQAFFDVIRTPIIPPSRTLIFPPLHEARSARRGTCRIRGVRLA